MVRALLALLLFGLLGADGLAESEAGRPRTYCNPIDLDYAYCPIPQFAEWGKHRTTADPVIVRFRGDYFLFSTNQWGYWWSSDLSAWHFVPRRFLKPEHEWFEPEGARAEEPEASKSEAAAQSSPKRSERVRIYDDLCAPAAFVMDDALYLIGSTYTKSFPIWKSTNPREDEWTEAVQGFRAGAWDPAFLLDDDGRLYLYHGSGNDRPIYGREIDVKTLQPKAPQPSLGGRGSERKGRGGQSPFVPRTTQKGAVSGPVQQGIVADGRHELIWLADDTHGWERFGEANDNTFLRPFIEGAWMTKHGGKYYLQYAAPGTEFSGYADGVYVGEGPLGPFRYQDHNPVSYKPGGFARGAGHGSTFQDAGGDWWHTSTIAINVKNNFERRIGIWPAGFDADGVMYCNTAYGDYPHYLPLAKGEGFQRFTGWMLLNYAKPVRASSTLGGFAPNLAVDEDIRTYWSAATGDAGEYFTSDLGEVCTVRAIQINYADQDATLMGKVPGLYHQYTLSASRDGESWETIVDKSENRSDVPHDYVELAEPVVARFVRIENRRVPTGKFALSGLRVFGQGRGERPEPVARLEVLRGESERRNAWVKWPQSADATGYVIYCGISPRKLYTSVMVYGSNEYYFRAMDGDRPYYFAIEAFNENGISARSAAVKVD